MATRSRRPWWKTTIWRVQLRIRGSWRSRYTRCSLCGTPSPKKMFRYWYGPMGACICVYDRLLCLHRVNAHYEELMRQRREFDDELDRRAAIRRELHLNMRRAND